VPEPFQHDEPAPRSAAPIGIYLFAVAAWVAAAFMWAAGTDVDDPARNYAATVALAVVGGALAVVAAIYDHR
jgi:hypothetical protein